ncbi:MAG: FAD binding domain-containing protein [Acidobacteria bacterium]|nr:FAD binding domain-containing protein [Acidobacteriota bacterium]
MRSFLPAYELRAPGTLAEALALMDRDPGSWRPFAGGTDLMVLLEAGSLPHHKLISLWGLRELRSIDVTTESVSIGALTTYSDVLRHPVLRDEFPLLGRAAADTGGVATQNRGTIGGNIANASPVRDVRLAVGSVAPTVIRARKAEDVLRGRSIDAGTITAARRALALDIAPIDDVRSTARYRLTVAQNLLCEFLESCA